MKAPDDSAPSPMAAIWDNVKTIIYALLLAMVIRFAIAQPFRIPSGSMQPTLMVGDYIVVTKWTYGYSRFSTTPLVFAPPGRIFSTLPKSGDVVVFRMATLENGRMTEKDFVKRLVGLPGDKVQMIDGALHINGAPVRREWIGKRPYAEMDGYTRQVETKVYDQYVETLPNGVRYTTFHEGESTGDNTRVYEVPDGHYLMMGDNRDNSADSRNEMGGFGFVPFDHLVGKAQFVFVSFDHTTSLIKPWTLITGFRGDRFVHGVE